MWWYSSCCPQPATVARKDGSSVGTRTRFARARLSHVLAPTRMLGRCLATEISASELRRKSAKSALLVGDNLTGHFFVGQLMNSECISIMLVTQSQFFFLGASTNLYIFLVGSSTPDFLGCITPGITWRSNACVLISYSLLSYHFTLSFQFNQAGLQN